ncbi:hypothetical protein FQV39_00875 [Bosea sp. F3-2]|nr:hypothetical protein FQV39_00875 [Bosea sp. F3-2]
MLHLLVLTQFRTQNRYTLLLELLSVRRSDGAAEAPEHVFEGAGHGRADKRAHDLDQRIMREPVAGHLQCLQPLQTGGQGDQTRQHEPALARVSESQQCTGGKIGKEAFRIRPQVHEMGASIDRRQRRHDDHEQGGPADHDGGAAQLVEGGVQTGAPNAGGTHSKM